MVVKEKKRVQVKVDKDLADDTEVVLSGLDLNPVMAINMSYKQIIASGALSFNASLSEEEGANLRFLEAIEGTPVAESKDAEEVIDWFNDPDED